MLNSGPQATKITKRRDDDNSVWSGIFYSSPCLVSTLIVQSPVDSKVTSEIGLHALQGKY